MRPQAANYGTNSGIPRMAQAMGMGRFRDPNAGRVSGRGAEMARQAVGSAPSDETAAAFLRALGGNPEQTGGPNMNPVVARRQVGSHEFAQAPMRPAGDGRQSYSHNMALVPRVWKSSPEHDPAVLAYVTPQEMDMLREADIYGSNISERMHFGPEFVPSLQGDGVGGGGGDGPSDGSGGGFGGGFSDPGYSDFGNEGDKPSTTSGPSGGGLSDLGPAVDVGSAPGAGRPSVAESPNGPDTRGTSTDPGYPGGPQGSYPGGPGVSDYGFAPGTGLGLLNGFIGAVAPGRSITSMAQMAGLKSDAEKGFDTPGPNQDGPGGSPDTGDGTGSPFVKPTSVAGPARPAAIDAPSFLDFESDDPLQRRAKIATFATQGTGGKWASDEAFDYWKNLTQRGLISDAGQMPDFANLLGTELGYLGSRGIAAPNQTRALLEAILSA